MVLMIYLIKIKVNGTLNNRCVYIRTKCCRCSVIHVIFLFIVIVQIASSQQSDVVSMKQLDDEFVLKRSTLFQIIHEKKEKQLVIIEMLPLYIKLYILYNKLQLLVDKSLQQLFKVGMYQPQLICDCTSSNCNIHCQLQLQLYIFNIPSYCHELPITIIFKLCII